MRAEQYLLSVKSSNDQLGKLLRLQEMLSSPEFHSRPEDQKERKEQLAEQINQAYDQNRLARQRVALFINSLPERQEREILKLLYISLLRHEDAAKVLGTSLRQSYRIKRQALMHLEGMRY